MLLDYLNPQALLRVETDSARYYVEIEPSLEKKFKGSTPIQSGKGVSAETIDYGTMGRFSDTSYLPG